MKHILYAASVFCAISIFSCREKPAKGPTVVNRQLSLPTGTNATTPANPVLPGNKPVVTNTGSTTINPAHGQPGHRCDIAVGSPIPAASQKTNPVAVLPANTNPAIQPVSLPAPGNAAPAVASGLNPAHGQPGHRCDIAVGAPLNSKPTIKTQPATSVAPTVSKPSVLQPDTLYAKGLNPAHGQPGHRCDIAVGKPLNAAIKQDTLSTLAPVQAAGN